jgi:hypothetical protein
MRKHWIVRGVIVAVVLLAGALVGAAAVAGVSACTGKDCPTYSTCRAASVSCPKCVNAGDCSGVVKIVRYPGSRKCIPGTTAVSCTDLGPVPCFTRYACDTEVSIWDSYCNNGGLGPIKCEDDGQSWWCSYCVASSVGLNEMVRDYSCP